MMRWKRWARWSTWREKSTAGGGGAVISADPGTFEYWQPATSAGELPARVMRAGASAGTFEYWQNGE